MGVKVSKKGNLGLENIIDTVKGYDGKKFRVGYWNQGDLEMIAGVHEFGVDIRVTPKMRAWFAYQGYPLKSTTTSIKIPERSFLRAGFDLNEKWFSNYVEGHLMDAFNSEIPPEKILKMFALEFKGKIQVYMRNLRSPALSDMTIERSGRSNPLVDSGQLVGKIRSEVE